MPGETSSALGMVVALRIIAEALTEQCRHKNFPDFLVLGG
jgi:hypothetical protein